MLSRIDQIAKDCRFAQFLASLEPVETFHQNESIAIAPHQDGALLTDLQNALGDFVHGFDIKQRAAFGRNIDVRNRKRLALHHDTGIPPARLPATIGMPDAVPQDRPFPAVAQAIFFRQYLRWPGIRPSRSDD